MILLAWNKLAIGKCYPESLMEEFKNFSTSLDNLIPYYKIILPAVTLIGGSTENVYFQNFFPYYDYDNSNIS